MKINWQQKLASRKFWLAIMGFVSANLVAFGVSEVKVAQVLAVVAGVGTLIAYITGESKIDLARYNDETDVEE